MLKVKDAPGQEPTFKEIVAGEKSTRNSPWYLQERKKVCDPRGTKCLEALIFFYVFYMISSRRVCDSVYSFPPFLFFFLDDNTIELRNTAQSYSRARNILHTELFIRL